ncbi:MAG: alpha/beta hydrolase [Gammaproteobacteria bacterium]|nr:alpha/beta hydrolase [Gammaproteobacteria bacterium]
MLRSYLAIHAFVILLLVSFTGQAAEESYSPVEPNVSFEAVFELPYRDSDHRISYGPDALQFGQLWLPDGDSRGLLVFIHGGCWLNQYGIDHAQAVSTALAQAGYAVWALEYRRTGDSGGGWPGTFEDVIAGINQVNSLSTYGVSTERLALLGHSAGGHLAVLAGARSDLLEVEPDLVVGLAAITDVVSYSSGQNSCQQVTPAFMGGSPEDQAAAYFDANPGNHGVHSPTILLQGDIDQIVPLSQATLPAANTRISNGAGHFDWVHPGTPAFRELLQILASEL